MKNQPDKSAGKTSSEPLTLNLLRGKRGGKKLGEIVQRGDKIVLHVAYRYKFNRYTPRIMRNFCIFAPGRASSIKFNKAFIARVEGKATMDKVREACTTSKSITSSSLLHYY